MAGAILERIRPATQIKPDRIHTDRYEPVIRRADLAPDPYPNVVPLRQPDPITEGVLDSPKSLLVVNRGVIATQIVRSAVDTGIPETEVMVWDGDRDTLTTQYLLELQEITRGSEKGRLKVTFVSGDSANDVYANTKRIIEVAKAGGHTRVDLGWGYNSEKHGEVRKLEEEGIFSVGPTADQIEMWGNKTNALRRAEAAGLNVLPWAPGSILTDWNTAKAEAERIGYPLLIKTDEGGGGNGITEVSTPEQFEAEWGKGTISKHNQEGGCQIMKKATKVRHIEFQILADKYGTVAIIGERDCSKQRRHQKQIEESVVLTDEQVEKTSAGIVNMLSGNYCGLGTVEFLMDEDGNLRFLELNPRPQVEHPVTEGATGLDLLSAGHGVSKGMAIDTELVEQGRRRSRQGHVVETRLFARENGEVTHIEFNAEGEIPGKARIDTACGDGTIIPQDVDGLQALIVTTGLTRADAIATQIQILENIKRTYIGSVKLNIDELLFMLRDPQVIDGAITVEEAEAKYAKFARMEKIADGTLLDSLFRHGEDTHPGLSLYMPKNDLNTYLANPDSVLTEHGKEQVIASLTAMNPENIAALGAIMTSPLRRSVQTAEIIRDFVKEKTGRTIEIVVNEDLTEVPISADAITEEEYQTLLARAEGDPSEAINEITRRWEAGHPGLQESHKATFARAKRAVDAVRKKSNLEPGQVYAVVTHGILGRVFQYAQAGYGLDPEEHLWANTIAKTPSLNYGASASIRKPAEEVPTEHPVFESRGKQQTDNSAWSGRTPYNSNPANFRPRR